MRRRRIAARVALLLAAPLVSAATEDAPHQFALGVGGADLLDGGAGDDSATGGHGCDTCRGAARMVLCEQ